MDYSPEASPVSILQSAIRDSLQTIGRQLHGKDPLTTRIWDLPGMGKNAIGLNEKPPWLNSFHFNGINAKADLSKVQFRYTLPRDFYGGMDVIVERQVIEGLDRKPVLVELWFNPDVTESFQIPQALQGIVPDDLRPDSIEKPGMKMGFAADMKLVRAVRVSTVKPSEAQPVQLQVTTDDENTHDLEWDRLNFIDPDDIPPRADILLHYVDSKPVQIALKDNEVLREYGIGLPGAIRLRRGSKIY